MLTRENLCFLNHAQLCIREISVSAFAGLYSTCGGVMSHTVDISEWCERQKLYSLRLRETEKLLVSLLTISHMYKGLIDPSYLSKTFHPNDTKSACIS